MKNQRSEDTVAARLSGLTKRYPGFQLGPIDLALEPGTVLALIGPNGAGKTTTLNAMAGLLVPDEGGTEIYGAAVDPARPEYRRQLGYVGEESGFFQRWTAARNLELMSRLLPGWSGDRVRQLVERFALPLDKPVNKLSRGNRAKLSLVAALGHGPRLLLLDEPTSGLDPIVRSEVLDVLWEISEDGEHAVLYSTHVLADISRLADELIFLKDGQIVLRSRQDELSERWRQISFRLPADELDLDGVVEHRHVRAEHQVITREAPVTLRQLAELGAESVEVSRMSVDEIVVRILKEGHHVARAES